MKDGTFVNIQAWMINDYNLTGNKALVYAFIYGFSQDNQGCFYGSSSYIIENLKLGRSTVLDILKELEADGLLKKWQEKIDGRMTNCYSALRPDPNADHDPSENDTSTESELVRKPDVYPYGNQTFTRTETGHEKEKNNKANNNKTRAGAREEPDSLTVAEVFDEFSRGGPGGLYDALMDFDQHRRELAKKDKKKLWTPLVAKKICKSIKRLVDEAGVQNRAGYAIAMLNQSIENGWTGVFAVKDFVDKAPAVHTAQPAPDKPRMIPAGATMDEIFAMCGVT